MGLSARFGQVSTRRRKTVSVIVAAIALAAIGVATALPAWAHHSILSGQTVCSDGDHLITWSITNSVANRKMTITAATATQGANSFGVSDYQMLVDGGGSTTAHTTVSSAFTGDITLTVHSLWTSDGVTATNTTTVTLIDNCQPGTTSTTEASTTTSTEAPTTTSSTEGPTTTSSTVIGEGTTTIPDTEASTTTTPEGPTTTSSTVPEGTTATAPPSTIAAQGSTAPTTVSSPQTQAVASGPLPFTGSSTGGPILGLLSLLLGAGALLYGSRAKKRRTGTD